MGRSTPLSHPSQYSTAQSSGSTPAMGGVILFQDALDDQHRRFVIVAHLLEKCLCSRRLDDLLHALLSHRLSSAGRSRPPSPPPPLGVGRPPPVAPPRCPPPAPRR